MPDDKRKPTNPPRNVSPLAPETEAKLLRMEVPGTVETFTEEEAEQLGAFEETALTEEEALEGAFIPDEHWETDNGYKPKDPL